MSSFDFFFFVPSFSPLYAVFLVFLVWCYFLIRLVLTPTSIVPICIPGSTRNVQQLVHLVDRECKEKLGLVEEEFLPEIEENGVRDKRNWTLCDGKGGLNVDAVGISVQMAHVCNLTDRWWETKKWNRWIVTNEQGLFCVGMVDLGYCYAVSIFLYVRASGEIISVNKSGSFLASYSMLLPNHPSQTAVFKSKNIYIIFSSKTDNYVNVRVSVSNIDNSRESLEAQFTALYADPKSPNISVQGLNTVLTESKSVFSYLSRYAGLPAAGFVKIGDKTRLEFSASNDAPSFAVADFVRGVFPRKISNIIWTCCSGVNF